jgi:hypothetical protein
MLVFGIFMSFLLRHSGSSHDSTASSAWYGPGRNLQAESR